MYRRRGRREVRRVEIRCEMELEKETKGAVRYMEKGEAEKHVLRTLYIRKSAFGKEKPPQSIQVTIESQA